MTVDYLYQVWLSFHEYFFKYRYLNMTIYGEMLEL